MSPRDWLWLILELIGLVSIVLGFVWRAIKMPLDFRIKEIENKIGDGLKDQGERIGDVESKAEASASERESLRRSLQQHEFQLASLARDNGRLEGMMNRIDKNLERLSEDRHEEDSDIRERLARIETSIQIFGQIRDALVAAVQHTEQRREI